MARYLVWIVLAMVWAAIALAGLLHHRIGNAALEAFVALLFLFIGLTVRRRDRLYTASRPR